MNFSYKRWVQNVVHHHLNIEVSSVNNKKIVKMKIAIICALLAGELKIQNLTFHLNSIVFQFHLSFLLILI